MTDQGFSYHKFSRKQRLSLSIWNVNGLNGLIDRIIGGKFENVERFCSTQNLSVNSNSSSNNVKRRVLGGILIFV